jgi:glycosyltransferase involved in cell wall biosynthesis
LRKKIIGIVTYTYLPATTGGHKAIASLYNTLAKGFQLVCIGTTSNDSAKANYPVHNIFSSSPLRYINLFNFFSLKKILETERPEYLQIEHPYIGWLAYLLKRSTGVKLIVRSHNIEGLRFRQIGKWWWRTLLNYERWVHRIADFNFFITDEDRKYAISNFELEENKCYTITYGINQSARPDELKRHAARKTIIQNHGLAETDVIVLFNGSFNYKPNIEALQNLLNNIFPRLKDISDVQFKLLVCGKNIPQQVVASTSDTDVIFAGFVPDINSYLLGANIFLNPITEGGGIKTKLVEAIAFNLTSVSYVNGAIGVSKHLNEHSGFIL